jgi:hypothetical protein
MSFLNLISASLKTEGKWTWTSGMTSGSSTGTTESASLIVGGPAFGYTGPTTMKVYYDRLYKTFNV